MEKHTEKALTIIERFCGQTFRMCEVSEQVELISNYGQLTKKPFINIIAANARCKAWAFSDAFGSSDWVPIPLNDIESSPDGRIVISGGILHSIFTEAHISYCIGYLRVPENIQKACALLDRQLEGKEITSNYSISALITPEIESLISPFKSNGGDIPK